MTVAPESLPAVPGAYLLLMRLDARLALALPRLGDPVLEPGWYAYCGSARGPGGITARVARHVRREKSPRWHIDRLTVAASEIHPLAFPAMSECDLVRSLMENGFSAPVPGFGSSDCRTCPAHLLMLEV